MICAENLTILRNNRAILRHFSYQISAGELIHLRGENGSGKSSLLQVLAGLNRPDGGTIRHEAEALYLGHGAGLHPNLTPVENLYFAGLLYHDCDKKDLKTKIYSILETLNLSRQTERACRFLSAGQRQRVQLARLWLSQEKLWLLDEPFNALDVQMCAQLSACLDKHLSENGAIILTSHQPFASAYPIREIHL